MTRLVRLLARVCVVATLVATGLPVSAAASVHSGRLVAENLRDGKRVVLTGAIITGAVNLS